jgi:two-component system, cell cycle sensor histidine kinase and response regulator CckA
MKQSPAVSNDQSFFSRPLTLKAKMLISFGALVAVMLLVINVVRTFGIPFTSYSGSYGDHIAEAMRNLNLVADLKKDRFLLWLEERKNDVEALARNQVIAWSLPDLRRKIQESLEAGKKGEALRDEVLGQEVYKQISQRLRVVKNTHSVYQRIQLVDGASGLILASTDETQVGEDVSGKLYLPETQSLHEGVSVTIEPHRSDGKGSLAFSLLMRPDGHVNPAVIVMFVDIDAFVKPMFYTGEGMGERGAVMLFNENAQILMPTKHPLPNGTFGTVLETRFNTRAALLAAQGTEESFVGKDFRGVPVLYATRSFTIMPGVNWGMVVKVDRAEVLGQLWRRVLYSILLTIASLIAAGVLGIVISGRISRPIENLSRIAQRVKSGDLSARAETNGSREVEVLSATFNSMMEKIQGWHEELEKQVKARTSDLSQEIARRKQAEADLAKEKERLAVTLRSIGDGVISTDTDGKVVSLNGAAEQLTGWPGKDAVGRPLPEVFSIINEKTRQPCTNPVDKVLSTGLVVGLANHTALISRDGTERVIADSGAPIRDEEGNTLGVVLVFRDVTEKRRAEERFQQEKEFTDLTIESLPGMFYLIDEDMRFIRWNTNLERMTGYSAEYIKALNALDLFQGQSRGIIQKGVQEVFSAGEAWREAVLVAKDGKEIPFLFTGKRIANDGKRQLVGMAVDITERKKAEEALRQSEEKYRTLFNTAPVGMSISSPDGRIMEINEVALDAFGYTSEEALEINLGAVYVNPSDREKFRDTILRQGWVKDYAVSLRKKDGTELDCLLTSSTLSHADGTIVGYQNIIQDITERKRIQDALLFERSQLLSIFDSINQAIQVVDIQTYEVLYVNSLYSELLAKDPVGEKCYKAFHGLESPCGFCPKEKVLALNGAPYEWEFHKDTPRRDFIITDRIIRWPDGRDVKFQLAIDITKRTRAEAELRLRNSAIASSITAFSINDLDGVLTYANPAAVRMWGYEDEAEGLGKPALTFWMSDKEAEEAVAIAAKTGAWTGELTVRRKDGSSLDVQASITLVRETDGRPVAVTGSYLDISERKRAERELAESEERFRQAFDSANIGVCLVDTQGRLLKVNNQMCQMFGYSRSEMEATTVNDIAYPEDLDLSPRFMERAISGEVDRAEFEKRYFHKQGHVIWGRVSSSLVRDYQGNPQYFISHIQNITEQKRLEKQLAQAQKMEAIGTLAGGIAHDFNNLLTVTSGYAEILLQSKEPSDTDYGDLQKILHASKRGAELVRHLLTFSRKSDSIPRPINLNHEVEQVKSMLARTIPKMIDIKLRLGADLRTVNADSGQIEQILMNLAVNARDAMPDGGILTIGTANSTLDEDNARSLVGAVPGEFVLLTVSDTGNGMDKETLDHIFEPFFTTKEAGKGTGLGLATVYGIVNQHGGHITCHSGPGEGTTFRIYLPVIEMEIDQDVTTKGAMPAFGTETILLVDDEEFVRDLGKRILSRWGYTVLTAADGKKALDVYRNKREDVSLIVLDWIMPEMGGKQCLEAVRNIDPKARVLIASGLLSGGTATEANRCGAKGFVAKPYNVKELLKIVRRILDQD